MPYTQFINEKKGREELNILPNLQPCLSEEGLEASMTDLSCRAPLEDANPTSLERKITPLPKVFKISKA